MKQKKVDQDRVDLKHKKGTWLRFVKLFPKCRLPWLLLAVYLILDVGLINLGVDETDYTAQLFAGDTSTKLVTTLVIYMVANLVGSSLLIFMRNVTSARITRNMRLVLLDKVFKLPMRYFQSEDPRDAVNRIVNRSVVIESTIMFGCLHGVYHLYAGFQIRLEAFRHPVGLCSAESADRLPLWPDQLLPQRTGREDSDRSYSQTGRNGYQYPPCKGLCQRGPGGRQGRGIYRPSLHAEYQIQLAEPV